MGRHNLYVVSVAVLAMSMMLMGVSCTMGKNDSSSNIIPSQLNQHIGQPVDIAPWGYTWRADRDVQEKAEAYFIPRRLERLDTVYRTLSSELDKLDPESGPYKTIAGVAAEEPLLPAPDGQLLTAVLWTGLLSTYRVELQWPAGIEVPAPESVEVREYPTSYGWLGWTQDKILREPEISADRRTWTYKSGPIGKMKLSHSIPVDTGTEMVVVFYKQDKGGPALQSVVPEVRVISPEMGGWKRMDLEIEWGFQPGQENTCFDGRIEGFVAMVGSIAPLTEDKKTKMKGTHSWKSGGSRDARCGIVVSVLYAPDGAPEWNVYDHGLDWEVEFSRKLYAHSGRPALGSRMTIWTKDSGFTFRISDLERGPIWIPEHGVFITQAGGGKTARQFVTELKTQNRKSICQQIREHREVASWDEVMQEVRLWTCPEGTAVPPFPKVDDPPMQVQLPDPRWTDAWRAGTDQLRGKHMWGGIAIEVGRVAYDMELIGLHDEADKVYDHFLQSPGVKSDGDYSDGDGSLEWASGMIHDMGFAHDSTHASTGKLLFAMGNRYFLTGDTEWFEQRRPRLQAAADWIIRQRKEYMNNIPNRNELFVAGLMPPVMLGDYLWPTSDYRWYYMTNAYDLQGLQRFADALSELDPKAGEKYQKEAEAFREDLRRIVKQETIWSPVRLGRDGKYHSFIPRMAYAAGLMGPELGAPQFPLCDLWIGALPLAETSSALDAADPRMVDTLHILEETGTSVKVIQRLEEERKKKEFPTDDAWFWASYIILPKASHNANIFLLQDDVPNFLRFWMNSYAAMVGANGKLWEHAHLGNYGDCEAPDNGTAGWFMENFRNMLVMEDGPSLWIARGTPCVWLEQGKKISIKNSPTFFGTLAYEIVSDVENGKITATIEIPDRRPAKNVIVRFRHPKAAPIKSVMVNGKSWKKYNTKKEIIELNGVKGKVTVVASY